MKIDNSQPPIIDAIDKVFHVRDKKGVIFCWGDTIFNPSGIIIPEELLIHEQVHSVRQLLNGPEKWWEDYLQDVEFRLHEEIPAHQAEWRSYMSSHKDRNAQFKYLSAISLRLSGPLYGNLCTYKKAKEIISG